MSLYMIMILIYNIIDNLTVIGSFKEMGLKGRFKSGNRFTRFNVIRY
jgi:hypothetical protein